MLFTDVRAVLPDRILERADLLVAGGRIAAVDRAGAIATDAPAIDGRGLTVLPGLIDMHGDMIESEAEPRHGVRLPLAVALYELDRRLAAAGVTTSYASISFWEPDLQASKGRRSAERAAELVHAVAQLRSELLTDMRVHARYEITTPVVAPPLAAALERGEVDLLSLMDHTPGQGQYRNVDRYVRYLAAYRNVGVDEVAAEAEERMRRVREDTEYWSTAHTLIELARRQGLPLASHDDDSPGKVARMAELGVTISEFPVAMEAAAAARAHGMHVAMGAPNALRGLSHSGNLSARAAIEAGVVDLLAADYAPAAMLQAVWALAEHGIALPQAAALVTANAADALLLHDRGRIVAGLRADLVLLQGGPTPRVRATLRQGRPIYWDVEMERRSARALAHERGQYAD